MGVSRLCRPFKWWKRRFFYTNFQSRKAFYILSIFCRRSRFRLDNEKRIEIWFDEHASIEPGRVPWPNKKIVKIITINTGPRRMGIYSREIGSLPARPLGLLRVRKTPRFQPEKALLPCLPSTDPRSSRSPNACWVCFGILFRERYTL